jgi:ABC-2 type transport system permease protein
MPIFDQGYQHWQGELAGHAWRWLAITRHGVRTGSKNRAVRAIMMAAWIPALGLACALIFWGLLEQKSSLVTPLLEMLSLPAGITADPISYRGTIWTLAFHYFLQTELFFSMVLVLLVGPSLISQDLRFNAIPLYFSRPLRRIDYFVGKLGVIGVFLAAVAIMPAVLAWCLGVLFSLDLSIFKDTIRLLLATIVYGALIVTSAGMFMLALSSLSRNSRHVAAFWVGIWFISGAVAGVLQEHSQQDARRAQYQHAQRNMQFHRGPGNRFGMTREQQEAMLKADLEFDQQRAEFAKSDWRPLVSYTSNLQRVGEVLLNTNAAWNKIGAVVNPMRSDPWLAVRMSPQYPWYWSAGILVGLFGLSLWILTTRVKSLDRLR